MKLSLGANLYYWPKQQVIDFYEMVAEQPVDIVYLGETVCAKRKLMRTQDWFELAERLAATGKEVVLSTLALCESDADIRTLRRICENEKFSVEVNDMNAVGLREGRDFVCGHSVNCYNQYSIRLLSQLGLKRWVMPLELGQETLREIRQQMPGEVETEVFAYGRLPLAYSARCYTARAHNLPKDDCQYRCLDYPDGLLLNTQEEQEFLILNGIQTQSAQNYNLVDEIETMKQLGVDVVRLSPQSQHMDKIIQLFHEVIKGEKNHVEAAEHLSQYALHGTCNGYWNQQPGMASNIK